MSEDIKEEEFEEAVAKYFPKCPLCASKSLEFDIEFGQSHDRIICHDCSATWEIDWKGEGTEIEFVRLVEVRDAEIAELKDEPHRPEFWQKMVSRTEEAQPISEEEKVCASCDRDVSWLPADATFCPYCGARLKQLSKE